MYTWRNMISAVVFHSYQVRLDMNHSFIYSFIFILIKIQSLSQELGTTQGRINTLNTHTPLSRLGQFRVTNPPTYMFVGGTWWKPNTGKMLLVGKIYTIIFIYFEPL